MKKIHLAIQIKANGIDRWKALHITLPENENIASFLKGMCNSHARVVTANVWPAKVCVQIVEAWNEQFRKDGRFLEDIYHCHLN